MPQRQQTCVYFYFPPHSWGTSSCARHQHTAWERLGQELLVWAIDLVALFSDNATHHVLRMLFCHYESAPIPDQQYAVFNTACSRLTVQTVHNCPWTWHGLIITRNAWNVNPLGQRQNWEYTLQTRLREPCLHPPRLKDSKKIIVLWRRSTQLLPLSIALEGWNCALPWLGR